MINTAITGRRASRRGVLKGLAAASAAAAAPWVVPAAALGKDGYVAPSEKIVLGAIGIGPRGRHDLDCLIAEKDVRFVAICDAQAVRRQAVKNMADQHYGNTDCVMYRDFRELLARSDIDAVLIATGDRWHAHASVYAVRAGKDVYSEKPCAITIDLCRVLAENVRRYGRVFQAGTQRRSVNNFRAAVQLARSGKLGKLHTMHASIYRPRITYEWLPEQPLPPRDEIDWDMWLGPCPWRPYNQTYVRGGWRGHDDFDSGATLLDWGAHTLDLCQWANNADGTTPVEYEPLEGVITCRYANGVKVLLDCLPQPFGDRSPHYHTSLGTCPVRFVGEEGWIETGDSGDIILYPESLRGELKALKTSGLSAAQHTRNFLDCVRTRTQPVANADVARSSHIACHAAALAWLLNRKLTFDPKTETFVNDDEANRMRSRAEREPWTL